MQTSSEHTKHNASDVDSLSENVRENHGGNARVNRSENARNNHSGNTYECQGENAHERELEGALLSTGTIDENLLETELVSDTQVSYSKSAAMMSALIVVSRITGFFRTWAQAFALGVTWIASCYTVANNLPNQLYELVVGGMLVTAFLPVYVSVKKKAGMQGSSAYASNLLSILTLLMGVASILGIVFAYPLIMTQSFGAAQEFNHDVAVYFFRFFAIEILLYALSSLFSGVLNAERHYFWSTAAPIFNNLICILSFVGYAVFAHSNASLAFLILAIGNPLGVLVQVLMQVPSLKKLGIKLTFHVNLKDPALKETLSLGIPSLVITLGLFVFVSVQSSCALSVTASGSAISYYARLWYTLPYSVIVVPISTALFTELSSAITARNMHDFKSLTHEGLLQILFFLIPLTGLLILFSPQLIGILNSGKFSPEEFNDCVQFLIVLATGLPFYGLSVFIQKIFSSCRHLMLFAVADIISTVVAILVCVVFTPLFGLSVVAFSNTVGFLGLCIICLYFLQKTYGHFGFKHILFEGLKIMGFSVVSVALGAGLLSSLELLPVLGPNTPLLSILKICIAGIPPLLLFVAIAYKTRLAGGEYLYRLIGKRVK